MNDATTTETTKTATDRNHNNGQFTFCSKFDRVCKCGRTLGVHDAVAPHPFGDYALDAREELPECDKFRHDKKASPERIAAALAADAAGANG
jgi:hypothetical protein